MYRSITFLSVVTVLGLSACQTVPHETSSRLALQEAKVETWRSLYRNNDADGLDSFLSDDFVIIGLNGSVQTKLEILNEMRKKPWDMPDDFLYTVTGIVFPTRGSAIVYGHGDSSRTDADGSVCHHNYTSSNVFRYTDQQWRPVSSHVSDSRCE